MNLPDWLKLKHGRTLELAKLVGRSGATVSEWSTGRKRVPSDVCPDVELATGGEVTCEEMRPDVKWHVLRNAPHAVNAPLGDACVSIQMISAPEAANDVALDAPGRA
jgi:DNA-binding transcriptional regulator YdaS (Cro superfamily)